MKKTISIILTAILIWGCSNDFLDVSNPSRLSPAVFPKSVADMEQVVTAIYGQLTQQGLYGKRIFAKGTFVTDHTVDMSWTADAYWNQLATNQITPDNTYISTLWFAFYKVINCANTVLLEADRINTTSFSQEDKTRLNQMRGEALFWRGWAHQHLVALWGEGFATNGDGGKQGIPLRLEVAASPEKLNIPRNTVDEVYDQILLDYTEAIDLLPVNWNDSENFPRPTSFAVKSFMGQLNLFKGDLAAAKIVLKDVIDNAGKELVSFEEYKDMFNEKQTKFNTESILEINFRNGNSGANFWNSEGSQHALLAALCFENAAGNVESAGWGNIFFHDSNIERFGSDPRLHVAALQPGTPVTMRGANTVVMKYKDIESSYQGWSLGKYIPRNARVGDNPYVGNSVGINMYLMRLADVYLLYAEANLADNESIAREYINKVRRRAHSLPVHAAAPQVDIASGGTQLRDDLREERFKEFCGEGVQHWVDVCRWKTLDQEINTWYTKTRVGTPTYNTQDLYYPIPMAELESNPNMNPSTGY